MQCFLKTVEDIESSGVWFDFNHMVKIVLTLLLHW